MSEISKLAWEIAKHGGKLLELHEQGKIELGAEMLQFIHLTKFRTRMIHEEDKREKINKTAGHCTELQGLYLRPGSTRHMEATDAGVQNKNLCPLPIQTH